MRPEGLRPGRRLVFLLDPVMAEGEGLLGVVTALHHCETLLLSRPPRIARETTTRATTGERTVIATGTGIETLETDAYLLPDVLPFETPETPETPETLGTRGTFL